MGRPISLSLTLTAGSANAICLSQSKGSAGSLTLNGASVSGGVATLSPARRVIIVSAADDSGITFTITGTDRFGASQTNVVTGTNGSTAVSDYDFLTVTDVSVSAATAGNVTVGTNNTASSQWVPWDRNRTDFQIALQSVVVSGSPTYQVDVTLDTVQGTLPSGVTVQASNAWPSMTGMTASAFGQIDAPVTASRLTLSAAGSVRLVQLQQGV